MIVHVKLSINTSDFDTVNYHCGELFKLSNRSNFGFVRYGLSSYEGSGRRPKAVESAKRNKPEPASQLFD